MSQSYNNVPTYDQPLLTNKITSSVWYRWFVGKQQGIPPSPEVSVALTAAPFTFVAPSGGFLIVQGGTVSALQFQRTGTHLLPATSGVFPLSKGDSLIITYSAAPTVTFVPQ